MPIMPTGDFITRESAMSRLRMDERMAELIREGGRRRGYTEQQIDRLVRPYADDADMMKETLA